MNRLNNRPRKTLGFATPNEMFFSSLNKQAA
jgi:IS30 family transposase